MARKVKSVICYDCGFVHPAPECDPDSPDLHLRLTNGFALMSDDYDPDAARYQAAEEEDRALGR